MSLNRACVNCKHWKSGRLPIIGDAMDRSGECQVISDAGPIMPASVTNRAGAVLVSAETGASLVTRAGFSCTAFEKLR